MQLLFLHFFFLMIRRPPRSTLFPYNDALPISGLTKKHESSVDSNSHPAVGRFTKRGGVNFDRTLVVLFEKVLLGKEEKGKRRSEEHTSELQSRLHLVCRLLLEKKKKSN